MSGRGGDRIEVIARGVCVAGGKVLLCRPKAGGYTYLPGGHVEFGETSREAVRWAWARAPGRLIVRVLVLPGLADEAVESLAWMATELSNEVAVSVMAQYTPAYLAKGMPPLDRAVTREEYETVAEAAADFGFENGWVQGLEASDPKLALLGENMPAAHGTVR